MSTSHKAILSLIITVVLFAVFAFFSFAGLFDLIETRFYNPTITTHTASENNRNAIVIEEYFRTIQNQLSQAMKTDVVRNSLMPDQSYEDFSALDKNISLIMNSIDGIQWVRFIDSGGIKIHFSTYSQDIINYTYQIPFYRNYNEPDLPYNMIAVENGGTPKYNFDSKAGRILFSFPLYDSFDIYCGTALFSLSMDSILDKLFNEGRMVPGKAIMLVSSPHGIVFGDLAPGDIITPDQISSVWETGRLKAARLSSPDSGVKYVLISTKTSHNLFIGSLIKEESYLFPPDMKLILLACFFFTMYLTIFLLFSLKQEPVVIIQDRLKQLQVSLLEQFYELKADGDWDRWIREMESRREDITALLRQGIRSVSGNDKEKIDALINKSWNELLLLLGRRREPGFDEEKLKALISSILAALPQAYKDMLPVSEESPMKLATGKTRAGLLGRASAIVKEIEETDLVEEIEEADPKEANPIEEIGDKEIAINDPALQKVDIDAVASQIEFSPEPEPETNEGDSDSIEDDLEIVSPFSAMLDDFTDTADYEVSSIGDDTLEQIIGPVEEKKIQSRNDDHRQKTGTTQNLKGQNNVIKEKEGLPFINAEALNPEKKEDFINPDFKNLVDSVIKD